MRDFIDEVLQNAKFCSDFEAQDDEDDTYFWWLVFIDIVF